MHATTGRENFQSSAGPVSGHFWTVLPAIAGALLPSLLPASQPFEATVEDPVVGRVLLSGLHMNHPRSDTLVVLIHGLGGDAISPYIRAAARATVHCGLSALCLSMRGADGSGEDIFHGGLTEDIRAALASPDLARYRRIHLMGFSVGGHLALKAALDRVDARLAAVAAICPPLDLDLATIAFDHPSRAFYRRHVFANVNRVYERAAARRRFLTPACQVRRARFCRERDAMTVVPRFSFQSPEDYYKRESVATRIHQLDIPSLLVAAVYDPIVPAYTLRAAIGDASDALTVRWVERGGHVYFRSDLDLGFGGALGLEPQVLQWLAVQQPPGSVKRFRS
ncbi:MAG: alpha/beta fold hydrolase [Bryobacteraceae bacterium]|jgi:predicted alpha/beta-fold hydrolase